MAAATASTLRPFKYSLDAPEWRPGPAVPGALSVPIPPATANSRTHNERFMNRLAGHWASYAGMHNVNIYMDDARGGKPKRNTSRYAFAQRRRKTRRNNRNHRTRRH